MLIDLRNGDPEYVQALHSALNVFLANLSHELRTPLNGILGFTEFLLDEKPGPLNARQKEYLNDVLTSGHSLLQIINDVMDLSNLDAGKMSVQKQSFSLPAAIGEALGSVSQSAAHKHLLLRRQLQPGLETVTLDRSKLMQVLQNLLSNAVKFTDRGEVCVSATLTEGHKLELKVSDTGIGIDPRDLGKLFIEFLQLDSGTGRRYGGAGLGLVLTRKLVELQGGTLGVESYKGVGSVFTVTLPV